MVTLPLITRQLRHSCSPGWDFVEFTTASLSSLPLPKLPLALDRAFVSYGLTNSQTSGLTNSWTHGHRRCGADSRTHDAVVRIHGLMVIVAVMCIHELTVIVAPHPLPHRISLYPWTHGHVLTGSLFANAKSLGPTDLWCCTRNQSDPHPDDKYAREQAKRTGPPNGLSSSSDLENQGA